MSPCAEPRAGYMHCGTNACTGACGSPARPTCFTKDTISCWYHGFTYDLESGDLCDIIASQEDPLIGKGVPAHLPGRGSERDDLCFYRR